MLFDKQISPLPFSQGTNKSSSPVTRRTLVKRVGVAAAVSTLAVAASPLFTLAANDNQVSDVQTNCKPSGINVLLVHGAFADGSSWSHVIKLLQREGHNVLAVQLPLTSLTDDVAVTRQALASASFAGPTVVVGHSYGGAVITGAASSAANVIGLVYASAFAPAEGESLQELGGRFAPAEGSKYTLPSYRAGFAWVDPAYFPQEFAADLAPAQARELAVVQKPIAFGCFAEKAGPAAWQKLPSWYLVSRQDKMINPDLERFMASRIKATTIEIDASHASPVSQSRPIVGLIEAAIKHYQKKA